MNKDLEAFEKWWVAERGVDDFPEGRAIVAKERQLYEWEGQAWQAACEYKQKEIEELKLEIMQIKAERNKTQFENAKLRECVEWYACLEKEKDYLCKKMENMREIYKNSEHLQNENKKLKQLLEKATAVIKRCEFGLQPEFYGGKDNGSLKDCRDFLKELEQK